MTILRLALTLCAISVPAVSIQAQQNLVLGRVLGQNSLTSIYTSAAPNIVEGREMTSPQGVALDTSVSPPIVYVSDTGNNRVLAWHDASSFNNGAFADFAIGQKDLVSNGYGSGKDGLREPGGLVVDAQGNLWVMDAHNSRILRFPKPFSQTAPAKMADLVIGQPGFTTTDANHGGISATSLALVVGGCSVQVEPDRLCPLRGSMAFDGSGNLWVTDSGNHRVLRYPVDPANAGKVLTTADRVLGQTDFASKKYTTNVTNASQFNTPSGLAIDGSGRLYVSDAAHRVLVFNPNATTATQFAGELITNTGSALSPPSDQSLNAPEGVTINAATGEVLVSDTGNNRVLVFPPIGQWPAQGQPKATSVIGQPDFTTNKKGVSAAVLSSPVHVAVTSTELFVVDSLNNRVVVFPQGSKAATRVLGQRLLDAGAPNLIEGKELYMQGLLPIGSGYQPVTGGLAMDTTGAVPHLYIADAGNNRVLGYCDARRAKQGDKADLVIGQPDLLHSAANGDSGTTPNDQNLWLPSGLVVDAGGNLFVSDTGNGRVLRFAAPCAQPQEQQSFPHANLVLGQSDFKTHDVDTNPTTLAAPFGLALTKSEGHLLVSDILQNRILRFDKPPSGDFSNGQAASAVFGQTDFYTAAPGAGPNQLGAVRHIAEDQYGRLYVADSGNNRIMVFSDSAHAPSNSTAALVFSSTSATAQLKVPHGVYVSKNTGELWVTELNSYTSGRVRVLKYPAYDTLAFSQVSTGQFDVASPGLAVTLDANDNVVITEAGNRVSEYFPAVNPLNGASWIVGRALAPGLISSVFVKYQTAPASPLAFPLPRDLGGVQVYVNGIASPLFYAGNSSAFPGYVQINFQIPSSVPSTGVVDTQVVEAATGQVLGAGSMMMKAAAPAFFTTNAQGTGQVMAVNKNDMSCNGATGPKTSACPKGTRPVHRGETLMLFLTGQGFQSGGPADGTVASGAIRNDSANFVLVVGTGQATGSVSFSGVPAGAVAGLWEIDVVVPNSNTVAPGEPNPVGVLYRDVPSEPFPITTQPVVWID